MIAATPCAHLIEESPIHQRPVCELGRAFPSDCGSCAAYSPGLTEQERTRCEVWTRVMGYHRPVHAFNPGKRAEHADRRYYVDRPGDLRPAEVVAPMGAGTRQAVVMPPPGEVPQPSVERPRLQPMPPENPPEPRYTFAEGHGHD
jgi:hypothetical protein